MHTSDKCKKNRKRILKLNLPSFFSSIGNKIQSPANPKFHARALTSQTWVPLYSVKHCWNTGAAKWASPPPELFASFSDGALSLAARYWEVYEEETIFGRRRRAQRRNHRNMLCRVCERCKWSVIRIYRVKKKKWRKESGANVCKKTASVGQKAPPSRHRLKNLKKKTGIRAFRLLGLPVCLRNVAVRTSVPRHECFPFGTYHIVAKLHSLLAQENKSHLSTRREN